MRKSVTVRSDGTDLTLDLISTRIIICMYKEICYTSKCRWRANRPRRMWSRSKFSDRFGATWNDWKRKKQSFSWTCRTESLKTKVSQSVHATANLKVHFLNLLGFKHFINYSREKSDGCLSYIKTHLGSNPKSYRTIELNPIVSRVFCRGSAIRYYGTWSSP